LDTIVATKTETLKRLSGKLIERDCGQGDPDWNRLFGAVPKPQKAAGSGDIPAGEKCCQA
jgi:hypothetical protein